jgi:hypothetical protein
MSRKTGDVIMDGPCCINCSSGRKRTLHHDERLGTRKNKHKKRTPFNILAYYLWHIRQQSNRGDSESAVDGGFSA